MRSRICPSALLLFISAGILALQAAINPDFTPRILVNEAKLVAAVDMQKSDKPDIYVATVAVLKGDKARKTMTFDFSTAPKEYKEEYVQWLARCRPHPALVFAGKFSDASRSSAVQAGEDPDATAAFLHMGGKWINLASAGADKWELGTANEHMEGTWDSSTDMFLKAVKYTIADSTADFPVVSGCQWEAPVKVGSVAGVARVRAIDLAGNGRQALFAMSEKGDRLFAYDAAGRTMQDVSGTRKLASKSVAAAWGDFNGDGMLDLASFDGTSLWMHLQQADGSFKAAQAGLAAGFAPMCKLMGVVGINGKACLVLAGGAIPVVVKDVMAKEAVAEPLAAAGAAMPVGQTKVGVTASADFKLETGTSRTFVDLLVADFSGDAIPDVICVGEKGSLLFKGMEGGAFMQAAPCAVLSGEGGRNACSADFDGDGRLDVFTTAEGGQLIWQNEGDGKFTEWVKMSGEIGRICKPNGNDCCVCDINNDGTQDVFISYEADSNVHMFFNRGFRSFGHAHDLDLEERELLGSGKTGQKSGCVADFNGDGAQDMVVALPDGELHILHRKTDKGMTGAAVVSLPAGHQHKGPVVVTGWAASRCLGAWNVAAGTACAFIAMPDAGLMTVKWQIPGGPQQSKDIVLENKAIRFKIP